MNHDSRPDELAKANELGVAMRATGLVVCLTLAACTAATPEPSRTPSLSATPAPAASSAAPSPSPAPVAAPLQATASVRVPAAFHYLEIGSGTSYRLLLFDEDALLPPVEVAHGGTIAAPAGPDVRSNAFSASADGRVVVVMVRESEQRSTYFLVRPETGEINAVLSGPDLGPPVITPDGQRIAYARTSQDAQVNGIWIFAVIAGGRGAPAPARIVSDDPQRVGSPPRPLAWSADAKWLAISPSPGESGSEVAVVDPAAGPTRYEAATDTMVGGHARILGPGYAVDWRGGEGNLLVTSSRNAFGGRSEIYAVDINAGATRNLYRASGDAVLGAALWHPTLDRYLYTERPLGAGISTPAFVRRVAGDATNVGNAGADLWWSKDGTRLFTTTGGDDSTGAIVDLLTGRGIGYCKRNQGAPPGCT